MENQEKNSKSLAGTTESHSSVNVEQSSSENEDNNSADNPWVGDNNENQNTTDEQIILSKDTKTVIIKKEGNEKEL
jgi:hypothetical protein